MKERIRKLRRALDLTQQEFADKIGMKRNTVANYETGRNEPSTSVFSLICREFNVNETWLRTGEGEMFNKAAAFDMAYNHFNHLMENATKQKRAVLSALIEMMYYFPDDKWDYVFNQFEKCLTEARPSHPSTAQKLEALFPPVEDTPEKNAQSG